MNPSKLAILYASAVYAKPETGDIIDTLKTVFSPPEPLDLDEFQDKREVTDAKVSVEVKGIVAAPNAQAHPDEEEVFHGTGSDGPITADDPTPPPKYQLRAGCYDLDHSGECRTLEYLWGDGLHFLFTRTKMF